MNNKKMQVKEKIIFTTINCIEKYGIQSITIRKISREANVNVAAINYYFGSKENLINEALQKTVENAIADEPANNLLAAEGESILKIMKEYFIHMMEGVVNYPNIAMAHLYDNRYESSYLQQVNSFLETLVDKLDSYYSDMSRKEIQIAIMQIMSSLIMVSVCPGLFENFADIDYAVAENREKYIDLLLGKYFNK